MSNRKFIWIAGLLALGTGSIAQAGSLTSQARAVLGLIEAAGKAGFPTPDGPLSAEIKSITGVKIAKVAMQGTFRDVPDGEPLPGMRMPRVRLSEGELEALKIKRGRVLKAADTFLVQVRVRNQTSSYLSLYVDDVWKWSGVPPGGYRDIFVTRTVHVFKVVDESGRLGSFSSSRDLTDSKDVTDWTITERTENP